MPCCPRSAARMALAKACDLGGLLEENGISLLGASAASLTLIDNPTAFTRLTTDLGLATPSGKSTDSLPDAETIAEAIGYPVFVRAAGLTGPLRHGIAFNVEELRLLVSGGQLPSDRCGDVRIEQALSGYREVEVELLRDADNRMMVVGMAENMDPVGIHSGDSVAVLPPLTLGKPTCRQIEAAACKLAQQIGVTGSMHVKFGVGPARITAGPGRQPVVFPHECLLFQSLRHRPGRHQRPSLSGHRVGRGPFRSGTSYLGSDGR
jgi:carbamoyl-phosphate synthase large subunit